MNIYNATEDARIVTFNNFSHIIGPGETKAFSDDAGRFIIMKHSCYGLVSLEYGDKDEAKYGSLSEFKKAKKLEGLKLYKDFTEHCLKQEQMFPRENNVKNGGEVELSNTQVPYFQSKLKEIDALIRNTPGKEQPKVALPDKAPEKRRGRPPRKVLNVNVSAAPDTSPPVS